MSLEKLTMNKSLYKITAIDDVVRIFTRDDTFISFVEKIYTEHEGEEPGPMTLYHTKNYINVFSDNLKLEITPLGLSLNVQIHGKSQLDLEHAIDELKKQVSNGVTSNDDSNSTGQYSYETSGFDAPPLEPLDDDIIKEFVSGHNVGEEQEQEFFDYYPGSFQTDGQYYRFDVFQEQGEENVTVTVFDGDSWESGDLIEIQSITLPSDRSLNSPK
jgi:hypothetical protein